MVCWHVTLSTYASHSHPSTAKTVFAPVSRLTADFRSTVDMPPHRSLKRATSIQKVSAISRRIHGWSWQAVSNTIFICSGSYVLIYSMNIVPDRNGYRCSLCRPRGTEGALRFITCCARRCVFLPQFSAVHPQQHHAVPPIHM